MNRILLLGVCLACAARTGLAQGLTFSVGNIYTYEFSHFTFQAGGFTGPAAEVGLTLASFGGASSFQFQAFEDTAADSPVFAMTFGAGSGLPVFSLGPVWLDFQGVFRLTMLAGTMTLQDFYGSVTTASGSLFSEKGVAVPEASPSKLILGAGFLAMLARFATRQRGRNALQPSPPLKRVNALQPDDRIL